VDFDPRPVSASRAVLGKEGGLALSGSLSPVTGEGFLLLIGAVLKAEGILASPQKSR
jgi:hypothetical protein